MLDAQLALFLAEGLGIHIGTRTKQLQPNGARVTAVRVDDDGMHLWAYVPQAAAGRVVPDLQATGPAAVVFARPTDDRACQVKGVFAGVRVATTDEQPFVVAQWERFLANLEQIGIPRDCAGRVERLAVDGDSHPRHRALRSDAGPWRRGPARMTPTLESLATCFQGLLPAQLFTCSRDGIPNAAYLSHVDYVDASHVALSFQFFNKSRRNITENPQALVIVQDPDTGQGWCLRLKYVRRRRRDRCSSGWSCASRRSRRTAASRACSS